MTHSERMSDVSLATKSETPQSSEKEKQTKSGKLSKLAKKAGLVLGLGTAIGLGAATLEGLKNQSQEDDIETLSEKKDLNPETSREPIADPANLEDSDFAKKRMDQNKIDELRRFIARESKSGDELYSVGKDPFAVPGEKVYEPKYESVSVNKEDEQIKHLENFFEDVIGEKYRVDVEKDMDSGVISLRVDNGLCFVSVEADGKYKIHNGNNKVWKVVDESQLEGELDNLRKRSEEGRKHDPFFSPFA